jgi:hypothetical protein
MNQRTRPPIPPEGGDKPQRRYNRRWNYWRRYPFYRHYDRYYNWYNRYYDWDYYRSSGPQQAPMPMPEPDMDPPEAEMQYLKIHPMLLAHLLDYSFKEVQSEEQIQLMLDKMMEISMTDRYLEISHYDEIIGAIPAPDNAAQT